MYLHARGSSKAPGTSVSMIFSSLTPLSMSAFLAPSIRRPTISGCQRARIMPTFTSEPSSSGKSTPPAMDGEMARRTTGTDGTADGRWKPRAQLSAHARIVIEVRQAMRTYLQKSEAADRRDSLHAQLAN